VHPSLSSRCLRLALTAGQTRDWSTALGALRLVGLLGTPSGGLTQQEVVQLQQLRQAALEDNGTQAHLACEALDKLQLTATAAAAAVTQ